MRIPLAILAGIALAIPGFAQGVGASASMTVAPGGGVRGGMSFPGRMFYPGTPVTGAPYSAERVSEHVQVAADGTRFTNNSQHETIYRDSEGRTRTERTFLTGPNAPADAPVIVEIRDPVANTAYILDSQNKVAHRMALNAPQPPANQQRMSHPMIVASNGSSRPMPQSMQEDLGQQMIEGVMAQGHRTTHDFPAGSQGNDRPFQVVSESWYSPDLHETVLSKSEDPRMGESTTKLININRAEPDPSLFQPPADYSIVDETGPFQIQWTAAGQ